ncbi:hypothetical protein LCGC14_0420420 [marine sediment metagenome]|uniref:Phosphoadenosine phosphosulphate reductase domain-containing protein n=1 Tax=marine sediment metagenome TaxID=412755 RepID=A0A0F9W081_9ZZZZ
MKRILSFGGGLQTTALAIMVAKGELEVDEVIFADTGAEKPETYWYMDTYIKPMLKITTVRSPLPSYSFGDMYAHYWRLATIPSVIQRRCTDHFKLRPIARYFKGQEVEMLIGFSLDEAYRARRKRTLWAKESYPLIEMQITATGCRRIIQEYGWPTPTKSSCFICQYQRVPEWNWLKNNHADLFLKALELELRFHTRRPDMKEHFGLLGGTPLWRMKDGIQPEMFKNTEYSCWSGHCGH